MKTESEDAIAVQSSARRVEGALEDSSKSCGDPGCPFQRETLAYLADLRREDRYRDSKNSNLSKRGGRPGCRTGQRQFRTIAEIWSAR